MTNAKPEAAGIAPRLLTRKAAAAYVGVSPGTFDRLVRKGILPARLEALPRWDIRALDATIDELGRREQAKAHVEEDGWAKWRRRRDERRAMKAAAPAGRQ